MFGISLDVAIKIMCNLYNIVIIMNDKIVRPTIFCLLLENINSIGV